MTITKPIIAVALVSLPVVIFGTVQAATNTESVAPASQVEQTEPVVTPTPVIESELTEPSQAPSVTSTPTPTVEPSQEPTPAPTAEPTIEPTATPTPSPTPNSSPRTNTEAEALNPSNPNVLVTCSKGASRIEVCREIPINPR